MRVKAALALQARSPLQVVQVDLQGPREGEVLVEIKATGVCHTDAFALSGASSTTRFPTILGHEGAGVVVETGPGVSDLKPGDHVIPLYVPECRRCDDCLSGRSNVCRTIRPTRDRGVMPDGTSRFSLDGRPVWHFNGTSTFAQFTVLPEIALARIRKDAPFEQVCYIGCGVTTGLGAALYSGNVKPGDKVVVFGLGGIGLNVVQGARLAGAEMSVRPVDIRYGKTLKGSYFGGVKGRTQLPRIVDWYMQGRIVVDELITEVLPLEQVNLAFERMHRGEAIRSVLVF